MKNVVENKNEKRIFAQGYCFAKIFMLFVIGSIVGVYYEQILSYFQFGEIQSRKGVIYGPFNPLYGLGFAAFIFLLGKNHEKRKWYSNYLYCCVIGGVTEYVIAWVMEILFQAKSWDYTGYFLNIGGKTTIPFMLVWGIGGMVLLKLVYPFLSKWIEKTPWNIARVVYPLLVIFMITDMLVSYTALIRQGFRKEGKEPYTMIGRAYDKIYNDEFLYKIYPNMEHTIDTKNKK